MVNLFANTGNGFLRRAILVQARAKRPEGVYGSGGVARRFLVVSGSSKPTVPETEIIRTRLGGISMEIRRTRGYVVLLTAIALIVGTGTSHASSTPKTTPAKTVAPSPTPSPQPDLAPKPVVASSSATVAKTTAVKTLAPTLAAKAQAVPVAPPVPTVKSSSASAPSTASTGAD